MENGKGTKIVKNGYTFSEGCENILSYVPTFSTVNDKKCTKLNSVDSSQV